MLFQHTQQLTFFEYSTTCVHKHDVIAAGFCKQQLWPLFHYVLPMAPSSAGRFNSELWQAYVKANKVRRYCTHADNVLVLSAIWLVLLHCWQDKHGHAGQLLLLAPPGAL